MRGDVGGCNDWMQDTMMDWIDILIAKLALWSIRSGYGYCENWEEDCPSCLASAVQDWLRQHVDQIRAD
jgi:hypothetical protein